MELKVWVEGIPRVVCGVSESTTCQEIVHALALAIGKTGCYNLTEKWRETERLLAPSDCPIQSLHNWGEYAPDVQYVLRHTGDKQRRTDRPKSRPMAVGDAQNKLKDVHHNILMRPVQNTNIKRNLTFSGAHSLSSSFKSSSAHLQSSSQDDSSVESVEEERSSFTSFSSKSFSPYASLEDHPNNHRPDIIDHVLSSSEHSGNSIRDKQGSSKSTFSQSDTSNMIAKKSNQRLLDSNVLNYQKQEDQVFKSLKSLLHKQAYRENNQHYNFDERSENVKLQLECNEREKLVQLLNQQLNHLCSQDVAMQKLQAEISSLEEEYSVIEPSYEHEICQLEEADEQLDSHIQELELVCWEEKLSMELNKRDELSKEIITIRQKLSVCEKDLEKCKKQLSTLSDEVALDTNLLKQKEENDVKNLEIKLQKELVHLQQQIHEKENEFAISTEDLKAIEKEMEILQHQIQNKILEEKHLDTELKGVNLEEFQVTPHIDKADIEKNTPFLNSATRPGSARKILYNPVALQEAISVNTSQPCWV